MINNIFMKCKLNVYILGSFFLISLCFSGCSNFRKAIGTEKIVFDEFAVVEKRKLIIPPAFDLQSQRKENQESYSQNEIYDLFGVNQRNEFDYNDRIFSQMFPFDKIVTDVRVIVDKETKELQLKANSGLNILFNGDKLPLVGEVLDAEKEQKRINLNKE